jgi:succinoglycan biosynthesis transport protein ExoP
VLVARAVDEQTATPSEENTGHLRDYLAILRFRKWSIILVTFLVVGGAMLFSVRQTPLYTSEARILVQQPQVSASTTTGPQTLNLETEKELVTSVQVAELAANRLEGSPEPGQLQAGLRVDVVPKTEILSIRYEAPDPLDAKQRAQAFAGAYIEFRRQQAEDVVASQVESIEDRLGNLGADLEQAQARFDDLPVNDPDRTELQTQINQLSGQIAVQESLLAQLDVSQQLRVGSVVQPANLPSEPSSPDYIQNAILALMVGLALGVGVAFLRERLDDRLRGRGDFEQAIRAPVLAVLPRIGSWRRKADTPLTAVEEPRSNTAEAYRTLRTSLLFAAAQREVKTIIVTSPHAGEGKTVASANLAVSLAQAGKRVIMVSADLRKPRLHRFFGINNEQGLTNVLIGEIQPWAAVVDVGIDNLKVVPSGPVPGNPAELLGSEAMGRFISQLREVGDFVILDTAPVLVIADALAVAPFADATLFLADAEVTTRGAVAHSRAQLDQVAAPVIGAVLNNFDTSRPGPYGYYGYYGYYYAGYGYRYGETDGRKRRRLGRKQREAPATPSNGDARADVSTFSGFEQSGESRRSRRARRRSAQPAQPTAEGGVPPAAPSGLWDLREETPRASSEGERKGEDSG